MLNWKKIRQQGLSLVLIWDLFMILLVMINLGLIVFDLTYLWLRPQYFHYLPSLTDLYDPIKGIHPHPMIERYLALVDRLGQTSSANQRNQIRSQMRLLTKEMFHDDSMIELGQVKILMRAQELLGTISGISTDQEQDVFVDFWSPDELHDAQKRKQFNDQVRPTLRMAYTRQRNLSGEYVDRFLLLDLPFLIIFVVEFFIRWGLALRRKKYRKWFVFPLYNWYELLGLIPLVQFRIFRLFRIASIYVRLRRSELTRIGDDFITRKAKRYADIITEEISDRVAIKIIAGIQDEIRSGGSVEIIQSALLAKQEHINVAVLQSIRQTLANPVIVDNLIQLVQHSLEEASSHYDSLKLVPQFIKETFTRDIGLAIFHALIHSFSQPLPNAHGKDVLADILDKVLDDTLRRMAEDKIGQLFQDITLEILESSKHVVAKKKWLEDDS